MNCWWRSLLRALARAASQQNWQGPLVIDEFPYLVSSSPPLASIMQAYVDHEARSAKLVIVLSGSSQHMMQGLALDRSSPLFGRSTLSFELQPLPASYIGQALNIVNSCQQLMAWSLWGGVPRYWELAAPFGADIENALQTLVLDPSGPLHNEPDRLLAEELPPAITLRPILDVVVAGAEAWEELCRLSVPFLQSAEHFSSFGQWGPAGRYWKGNGPEFDVVSISVDGLCLLLGEVKWSTAPFTDRQIEEAKRDLLSKGIPRESWSEGKQIVYALFIPDFKDESLYNSHHDLIRIIKCSDVLGVLNK